MRPVFHIPMLDSSCAESLHTSMLDRSSADQHSQRRNSQTASSTFGAFRKFPSQDELLSYPEIAQYVVRIWCHDH